MLQSSLVFLLSTAALAAEAQESPSKTYDLYSQEEFQQLEYLDSYGIPQIDKRDQYTNTTTNTAIKDTSGPVEETAEKVTDLSFGRYLHSYLEKLGYSFQENDDASLDYFEWFHPYKPSMKAEPMKEIEKYFMKLKNFQPHFRINFDTLSLEEAARLQRAFDSLLEGTWFHENHFQRLIREGSSIRTFQKKLDKIFPKLYLKCLNENSQRLAMINPNNHKLKLNYNKNNVKKNETMTRLWVGATALDKAYHFINKKLLKRNDRLTGVDHSFKYVVDFNNSKNETLTIGYKSLIRYFPTTKELYFSFLIVNDLEEVLKYDTDTAYLARHCEDELSLNHLKTPYNYFNRWVKI
ncbi:hypothetical protein WICPIJ_005039 [Wickerhamomyces pijperi]|uniref:Uncharacterized protein n=1 Tax=Wickerhamomyces pijperi TaxID=599730 RepID=A0A9P8TM82_WICPI|nr:hypothetical protein WICPIJ_005039 [Wickerhamomyces pijperi]